MDWLRQIPIGQYVDGTSSWLRLLDARLKLSWPERRHGWA